MIWEETLSAKGGEGTRDGSKQGAWYKKILDLSDYAEQEIYIAFRHFNCTNQFYVNIDDIVLVNESKKDDKAVVSYDVYLDDVLEATVTTNYYQHNDEISESHHVTKVVANYITGSSEAVEYDWTYSSCENLQGVTGFTAEYFKGKAVLNWNMYGEELPDVSDSFFFDFENGTIEGWTTIDADGDNYTWRTSAEYMEPGQGNNGSQHFVLSESFNNQFAEVLYPDNYFVTVEKYAIKEDSELSFYVCAQDGEFAAEHYGIAISLAGNTNPNDFTMIWEETLEGDGKRDRQTKWSLRTIDLGNYAGREIHIAFRHFNCHDQYMLDIDDITLATSKTREDVLTPMGVLVFRNGELITPEPITENSFAEPFVGEEAVEYCVRVVYNHNIDPETEQPGDINYTGSMSCPQCATVEYVMECEAPVDITAENMYYNGTYGVKLTWSLMAEPKRYNVYRSTDDVNYELVAQVSSKSYTEGIEVNGTYHYQVTAVYVNGEEECESEPIHVSILVPVNVNENMLDGMMIYPNPTRGGLNIKAEGITRITISNTLGQVVYDINTNSNDEIVDMSQYEAGIYMVRVMTDNGVSTRRITLVK
jgi:hypothetical protein